MAGVNPRPQCSTLLVVTRHKSIGNSTGSTYHQSKAGKKQRTQHPASELVTDDAPSTSSGALTASDAGMSLEQLHPVISRSPKVRARVPSTLHTCSASFRGAGGISTATSGAAAACAAVACVAIVEYSWIAYRCIYYRERER